MEEADADWNPDGAAYAGCVPYPLPMEFPLAFICSG
jgi:hypothetical protein